ncbi:MAG: S-methyl-5-thioribose-1-phosphate isomerase [Thermoanaerobacteraceae bacterium]|nr:S-methyl-5-thioribose-1-phosphate isomerase [Thermoanaerobacteraceae bacterium]
MRSLWFENDSLMIIDQTLLPGEFEIVKLKSCDEVAHAIKTLMVRGAPAIGVAAAYGLYLGIKDSDEMDIDEKLNRSYELLRSTRPTAVNLFWALERTKNAAIKARPDGADAAKAALLNEANEMADEDVETNRKIGEYGNALVKDGFNILTHCNAGALATVDYGTAVGVIRAAHESGKMVHVYADETRPLLQGARLTAWELKRDGIPVTLITDNMAGFLMKQGRIDMVVVGADRIARNGDTANKIGTYSVAVLAAKNNVPFYVAAPLSTIDMNLKNGSEIPIEERNHEEVTTIRGQRIAPEGIEVYNPAFDVTEAELIKGIITEKGIAYPPYGESLQKFFNS